MKKKKSNKYLKLAFPKTLRKVKSGSTRGFLPACLDILKGNDLTVSGTTIRPGHRDGNFDGEDQTKAPDSNRHPR